MIVPLKFISVPATDQKHRVYKSVATGFEAPLPDKAMHFMMAPFLKSNGIGTFGECGINEKNVAMSSTESVYGNPDVLAFDPYVKNGIAEDALLDLVLPYITSARDGVAYLGKLYEKYGSFEGDGIIFSDKDEVWYMEIACGHRWVAKRLPEDQVAVIANMCSIDDIDFEDADNYMWSPGIQEFVEKHHLNPDEDRWSFRRIFGTSRALDRRYNTPRVWYGQNYLGLHSDNPASMDMPFSFKADRKVSLDDVSYVLSSHYEETRYDPLNQQLPEATRKEFRPVSMERCAESHILQIRGDLPYEIQGIIWFNSAPTAFNPYVPIFAQASDTAPCYNTTSTKINVRQAYWSHRLLAVLAERNYAKQAEIVGDYLDDCKTACLAHVEQVDGLAENPPADWCQVLTQANRKISDEVQAKTMECIGKLMARGMELSALRYDVNTDVL